MNQNPPNNGELPLSSSTGGTTVIISVFEPIPPTTSTTPMESIAQSGSILSYVGTHGPLVTSSLVGTNLFGPYMHGLSMPLNGSEQPYGMPTSMMASFHNTTSMFTEPVVNATSPLQGSDSAINNMVIMSQPLGMGFPIQTSNLTNNSTTVIRKQMDKSNHEMVQMLDNQMGTIFNPLIQNITQMNKTMEVQITCIDDLFGVPQPHRHP